MSEETEELQKILSQLDVTTATMIFEIDLGEQAKEFINSDLGRHLTGCIRQEIILASGQLARVAPWRRRKIQELQNRIWRAEFLLSWLRDLLVSGHSARATIEEAEHE